MLSSVMPDAAEARGVKVRPHGPGVPDRRRSGHGRWPSRWSARFSSSACSSDLRGAARSFTDTPLHAMGLSVAIALATVWTAIALSYVSNLPIGFFVGTISACSYAAGRGWVAWRRAQTSSGDTAVARIWCRRRVDFRSYRQLFELGEPSRWSGHLRRWPTPGATRWLGSGGRRVRVPLVGGSWRPRRWARAVRLRRDGPRGPQCRSGPAPSECRPSAPRRPMSSSSCRVRSARWSGTRRPGSHGAGLTLTTTTLSVAVTSPPSSI